MDGENTARRRRSRRGWLVAAAVVASWSRVTGASADDGPRPLPSLSPIKIDAVRPARVDEEEPRAGGDSQETSIPEIEVLDTEIHTAEPTVAGARLLLEVGRGAPEGTRFRWIQTEGPRVDLEDPTKGSIEVTIPDGADRLEFLLVAAAPDAVRVVRVKVPISGEAARSSWGTRPTGAAKADAGDDQIGLAGRRVTLNGSQSRPGDGKGARWLQTAGAPVLEPSQDGPYFSFVPPRPGSYKFLLMVAADGEVSEPDEVTVEVGTPPTSPGPVAAAAAATPTPTQAAQAVASPPTPPTPARIVAAALPRLADGGRLGASIADVMEAVSQRTSLYESFAALQGELLKRLEVVVPADPVARSAWNDAVFSPLTLMTAQKLLAAGLDVRRREDLDRPLSPAQQELLGEHFQELARAFRAGSRPR